MLLRLSPSLAPATGRQIRQLLSGFPALSGAPISLSFRSQLTAHAGQLLSQESERGTAVHAAAFIRERRIVVERELLSDLPNLRLIVTHEVFHFVWARLGNPLRREFGILLTDECGSGARGDLGESSAVEKGRFQANPAFWRSYLCESFCDTAAWLYAGVPAHEEFRLADKWRRLRKAWFEATFSVRRAF